MFQKCVVVNPMGFKFQLEDGQFWYKPIDPSKLLSDFDALNGRRLDSNVDIMVDGDEIVFVMYFQNEKIEWREDKEGFRVKLEDVLM